MKNLFKYLGITIFVCILAVPVTASLNKAIENQVKHNPQLEADDFVLTAKLGRIGVIQAYIKSGINVNVYSSDGSTALMAASEKGHLDIVNLLLRKGAKVQLTNKKNNRTALMEASAGGHANVVKALLASPSGKAIVNKVSNTGTSALSIASGGGSLSVVRLLLNAGAMPELQDKNGMTALMKACANDKVSVAKELIQFYENKKFWSHQTKLLYARNKNGKLAQELTHSREIQDALFQAKKVLYSQTHNE